MEWAGEFDVNCPRASTYTTPPLRSFFNPHKVRVTVRDRNAPELAPHTYTWSEFNVYDDLSPALKPVSIRDELELNGKYPDPFNPSTSIYFTLDEPGRVLLKVYDITGRVVATLGNGYFGAGNHSLTFDGSSLARGMYFYTIQNEGVDSVLTRTMLLVKKPI